MKSPDIDNRISFIIEEKTKKMLVELNASPTERILYYIFYPSEFFKNVWLSITTLSWKI
tara:strand:+ start:299 stop:475 length:177 start_codon:yes stop_codon:yes gene_type:complete